MIAYCVINCRAGPDGHQLPVVMVAAFVATDRRRHRRRYRHRSIVPESTVAALRGCYSISLEQRFLGFRAVQWRLIGQGDRFKRVLEVLNRWRTRRNRVAEQAGDGGKLRRI